MRKGLAAFGSAIFFVLAPGTVAGVVPWAITRWTLASPDWPQLAFLPLAAVLIAAGLIALLDSFGRFVWQGLGTPTPLMPTNKLIVTGLYRHVRNPMYVAVLSLILGQVVLFGSTWLALYAVAIWTMFHLSIIGYEEPRLRAQYGYVFDTYCHSVRRWVPSLRSWRGL